MDKLQEKAPNDVTDYRIVKLTDGSTIVGSITLDKDFLRIQNPLRLITVPRVTEFGVKDDSTLSPWVPFSEDKLYVIPKDKIVVISRAAKELAHYYEVILRKLQTTKIKTTYSEHEINKIMEIAEELDKRVKEQEDDEGEYYEETKVTLH